jgi:hypothetical protein
MRHIYVANGAACRLLILHLADVQRFIQLYFILYSQPHLRFVSCFRYFAVRCTRLLPDHCKRYIAHCSWLLSRQFVCMVRRNCPIFDMPLCHLASISPEGFGISILYFTSICHFNSLFAIVCGLVFTGSAIHNKRRRVHGGDDN